jgi:hypothetical protein
MNKQILRTGLILLLTNVMYSQTSKNLKTIIKNEKLEEFTISILKKADYEGIIQISKVGETKPIINLNVKGQAYDFANLKTLTNIISFEDFNFDGEKEIVIPSNDGIYIFDRKSGKPKNLFEKEKDRKSGKEVRNYIFTYRGSYEIDEIEKTIKITGSNSAFSGIEETYKADGKGNLKLTKKCEWDEI